MKVCFSSTAKRRGLTLLELVIVLTILAALGGVIVMSLGNLKIKAPDGTERSVEEVTALETLRNVRKACEQYFEDTNQWPAYVGDLLVRPDGLADFEPSTKTGWNGPYLFSTGARYRPDDWHDEAANFEYAAYHRHPFIPAGNADPAVLDAWGCPVVIQQADGDFIRLVSGGPNRSLETNNDVEGTNRGDDLVLFLQKTDPLVATP